MPKGEHRITHGFTRGGTPPEYFVWRSMKMRCHLPSYPCYADYGGRGIRVCDEWRASFVAFINHVGWRPSPLLTLDRIDNNRGYEPGNVRWATRVEQSKNRRNSKLYEHNGQQLSLSEYCLARGLNYKNVSCRLWRGWTFERATGAGK